MVNTVYDTAGQTPAASPWAAVGVSAFDELLYQAILNQPDSRRGRLGVADRCLPGPGP